MKPFVDQRRCGPLGLLRRLDRRNPALLVFLLMLLGMALRLPHLSDRPLWFDEVYQYDISYAGDLGEFQNRITTSDRSPPGYPLVLRGAMELLGPSEVVMRLPSLLFGAASIGAAWLLGRAWAGRTAGIVLALALAACPTYVFYSREARAYAAGILCVLLFLLAVAAYGRRPSGWSAMALAVTGVMGVFCQYAIAVIVAVGLSAALYVVWADRRLTRATMAEWAAAGCVVLGAALTVVFVYMKPQLKAVGPASRDFADHFFHLTDPGEALGFLLCRIPELAEYSLLAAPLGPRWRLLCLAAEAPVLLGALWAVYHRGRGRALLAVSLGVAGVFVVMAGTGLHPFGGMRHCLPLTPGLLLLWAIGVGRLERRWPWLAEAALALAVGATAYGNWQSLPHKHYHDFRGLLAEIAPQAHDDDTVLVTGVGAVKVLEHYRRESVLLDRAIYVTRPDEGEGLKEAAPALRMGRRLWVIEFALERQEVDSALRPYGAPTAVVSRTGIVATLWTPALPAHAVGPVD